MLVHFLSASARTVDFLVTTVLSVFECLVAANSFVVSILVYVLSSLFVAAHSTYLLISYAISSFLDGASAFGEDVGSSVRFMQWLCRCMVDNFLEFGTSVFHGTSSVILAIYAAVRTFFTAIFGGIASTGLLVQFALLKTAELVALIGSSFIFGFEFVAFLVKLGLRSVLCAVVCIFETSFLLIRSLVALGLDLILSVYLQIARLGQGITFGLLSTVKAFPVDAVVGFLVVIAAAYVVKKKANFGWLQRWHERTMRLWWRMQHIVRLVLSNVDFRDNGDDEFSDLGEEMDLLDLDSDDGRGSVFSLGSVSRASRQASVARHCGGSSRESSDSQSLCVICQDAPKSIAILPCRHVCLCEACRRSLLARRNARKCPICRVQIQDTMKLYL